MFEMHLINGESCPVFVCDMCGDRLVEAGKAAVVFDNFAPDGAKIKALHVHKGSIDKKTCHEEAEKIIRAGGGTPGWQEMKRCLTDLSANCGFPAADMAEYAKRDLD